MSTENGSQLQDAASMCMLYYEHCFGHSQRLFCFFFFFLVAVGYFFFFCSRTRSSFNF